MFENVSLELQCIENVYSLKLPVALALYKRLYYIINIFMKYDMT